MVWFEIWSVPIIWWSLVVLFILWKDFRSVVLKLGYRSWQTSKAFLKWCFERLIDAFLASWIITLVVIFLILILIDFTSSANGQIEKDGFWSSYFNFSGKDFLSDFIHFSIDKIFGGVKVVLIGLFDCTWSLILFLFFGIKFW